MWPFWPICFSLGAVLTESGAVLDWGRFQLGPFWLATGICMDTYNVHLYCDTEECCGNLLFVSYNSCRIATYIYVYMFLFYAMYVEEILIYYFCLLFLTFKVNDSFLINTGQIWGKVEPDTALFSHNNHHRDRLQLLIRNQSCNFCVFKQ